MHSKYMKHRSNLIVLFLKLPLYIDLLPTAVLTDILQAFCILRCLCGMDANSLLCKI